MKKHNFSAGPSILPQEVLLKASQAVVDYNNSGLSLIEISHRSKDFVDIMENARALALELLGLEGKGYKALFLQGGASTQFLMVALNLLEKEQVISIRGLGQTRPSKKQLFTTIFTKWPRLKVQITITSPRLMMCPLITTIFMLHQTIPFLEHR